MLRGRRRGATVIEFALVAFVMFLVFWGIFDFGREFYVRNTTQHLTRCMARAAVVAIPSHSVQAKQECLMGDGHSWPLFILQGGDLTDSFQLEYLLTRNASAATCPDSGGTASMCVDETAVSTGVYDNQAVECVNNVNSRCIFHVRAYYAGGPITAFGLLASWMGTSNAIGEPLASTTMPAENMGWLPP